MEYITSQIAFKGQDADPTLALTDGTITLDPTINKPGHGGNTISIDVAQASSGVREYASRSYPTNANFTERPGAVVEYNINFGNSFDFESVLPNGYIPALFLESTGTQYIITNSYMTDENVLECCYQTPPVTGSAACYIFGNQTPPGRTWAWGEYGSSNTKASAYTWTGTRGYNVPPSNFDRYTKNVTRLGLNFVERNGVQLSLVWDGGTSPAMTGDPRPLGIFGTNYPTFRSFAHKIWYFKNLDAENNAVTDMIPVINPSGTPGMFDKMTQTFFANDGSGSFIVGMTAAQAWQLGKLPPGGGSLTVSLPAAIVDGETVTDAAVQAALDAAAAKGWTITIQTYTE